VTTGSVDFIADPTSTEGYLVLPELSSALLGLERAGPNQSHVRIVNRLESEILGHSFAT
jgi:hypothetical protein